MVSVKEISGLRGCILTGLAGWTDRAKPVGQILFCPNETIHVFSMKSTPVPFEMNDSAGLSEGKPGGAEHCPPSPAWIHTSLAGWRLWLAGDRKWKAAVLVMVAVHLSFLPWPPSHRTLWTQTAWDTHLFAIEGHPAVDFFSIYEAGARVLRGMDPYSANEIDAEHPPVGAPYVASFRYVPAMAWLLAAPLALFPPWWAYGGWILLNELLLLFNLGLTAGLSNRRLRRGLGALWLLWWPLHIEWYMGQFSFAMGCLLFWTGLALWQGHEHRGLIFWGLSTWLKNWTGVFWLWWLVRSKATAWRATVWVGFLAASTIGYFVLNPHAANLFYNRGAERRWAGGMDDLYWGRQGVQMIPAVLFAGGLLPEQRQVSPRAEEDTNRAGAKPSFDVASIVNLCISISCLGLIIWLTVFRREVSGLDIFGLVWLWWFFAYLDTWEHHYVMLLPWLVWMGLRGVLKDWMVWGLAALWGLPSLLVLALGAVASGDTAAPLLVMLYFLQRPLGVFLVFGFIAYRSLTCVATRG